MRPMGWCCLLLRAWISWACPHWKISRPPLRLSQYSNFLSGESSSTSTTAMPWPPWPPRWRENPARPGISQPSVAHHHMKRSSLYCFPPGDSMPNFSLPRVRACWGCRWLHCVCRTGIKAFFPLPHLPLLPTACLPSPAGGQAGHICTSQCIALLYKVFFVNQKYMQILSMYNERLWEEGVTVI